MLIGPTRTNFSEIWMNTKFIQENEFEMGGCKITTFSRPQCLKLTGEIHVSPISHETKYDVDLCKCDMPTQENTFQQRPSNVEKVSMWFTQHVIIGWRYKNDDQIMQLQFTKHQMQGSGTH